MRPDTDAAPPPNEPRFCLLEKIAVLTRTHRTPCAVAFAVAACLAPAAARAATAPTEHVLNVPGFGDFIAVDGSSIWITNSGRVEHWSKTGKLGQIVMTHPCGAMAVAFGSLWVADCQHQSLNRVDPKTSTITVVIPTGIANPRGELNVVAGAGSVWVASDAKGIVARVDPAENRLIASIRVDPGTFYLTYGFGSLWAVSASGRTLQKIDPDSNRVVGRTALGRDPGFLVAGAGAVWVQEQGDGTVVRVDPTTGTVTGRVKVDQTLKYGDIDAGGNRVWLRTTHGQTFVVINPQSLAILSRTGPQTGSGALRYTPDMVWTTSHDRHTLSWWEAPGQIGASPPSL